MSVLDFDLYSTTSTPQIFVRLLANRPSANNFFNSYSLQEFTRATNVRFRLIRVKNLLGHLMPVARQDPTTTRRVSSARGFTRWRLLFLSLSLSLPSFASFVKNNHRVRAIFFLLFLFAFSTFTRSKTWASVADVGATATRTCATLRTRRTRTSSYAAASTTRAATIANSVVRASSRRPGASPNTTNCSSANVRRRLERNSIRRYNINMIIINIAW